MQAIVWSTLDAFIGMLRKVVDNPTYDEQFVVMLNEFTNVMVDAWGKSHIMHYMVSKVLHIFLQLFCFD